MAVAATIPSEILATSPHGLRFGVALPSSSALLSTFSALLSRVAPVPLKTPRPVLCASTATIRASSRPRVEDGGPAAKRFSSSSALLSTFSILLSRAAPGPFEGAATRALREHGYERREHGYERREHGYERREHGYD